MIYFIRNFVFKRLKLCIHGFNGVDVCLRADTIYEFMLDVEDYFNIIIVFEGVGVIPSQS